MTPDERVIVVILVEMTTTEMPLRKMDLSCLAGPEGRFFFSVQRRIHGWNQGVYFFLGQETQGDS